MILLLDQLERLAKLRSDGALTDNEFHAARASLVANISEVTATLAGGPPSETAISISDSKLSPTWRKRFHFFDEHGMPGTPGYAAALRRENIWVIARQTSSTLAFLFGPFYFLYLGLWRSTLVIVVATIAGSLVLDWWGVPDSINRYLWIVPASLFASSAIPLYYLRHRHGILKWNPIVLTPHLPPPPPGEPTRSL